MEQFFQNLMSNQYAVMGLVAWELVWKGFALWKAAKVDQKIFFALLLVVNTMGLLPIVYLIYRKILEKRAVQPNS